ncbi:MAG: IS200/IS605 family transposase [Nitrospirae bacterium]|nr:IS200/IS605 family transposase [Nitrospirota bacterium]
MRRYRHGAHTKTDLKVHLVWIPKYRKPVLTGDIAIRVRDLIRQIVMEHELEIIRGKVASDHIHVFLSCRAHQDKSQIAQRLKGISPRVLLQEYPHLRKKFWGRHFWARGFLAVSSGTITDEMTKNTSTIRKADRSWMTVDFQSTLLNTPRLRGEGCSFKIYYHKFFNR